MSSLGDQKRLLNKCIVWVFLAVILSARKPATTVLLPETSRHVAQAGDTAMSARIEVELDIFSGNPNPRWILSNREESIFLEKLDELPEAPAKELSAKLGYRGFIVQVINGSEQSLVKLQKGTVQFSKGDTEVYYSDQGLDLEQWLLNSGKPYLKSELFHRVEREFQNAEKTGMNEQDNTPLTTVSGWRKDYIDKLAKSWITNAEQVVGMAATQDGVQALARQLNVSVEEMRKLIDSARASLPPSVARELEIEVDTSQYGLGALPPATQPKPWRR